MRLDNDPKLDFKDVLIRPKRSTLQSRSQVSVSRKYTFRNSGHEWAGVPIMAANMDTVGTFEMAKALSVREIITCMHKHYTVEQWEGFAATHSACLPFVAVSAGTSDADFEMLQQVLSAVEAVRFICLDVANGYSEVFVDQVRKVRQEFPQHTIAAGNVVTGEMVEELLLSGADIIKVGIGPGSVCTRAATC